MEAIRTTLQENLTGTHGLAPENERFSLDEVPDLNGKVAVVTGGSQGVGYGCTHTLLKHNISKLFILSSTTDVAADAINGIRKELGDASAEKVQWLQVDLKNWKDVAQTASKIRNETDRLDILINNAAKGIAPAVITSYGVDEHMATNHVGHVVLTSHLLPILKKTAQGDTKVRIVDLGSNAHQQAPSDTKFATTEEMNHDYGSTVQYGRSKLATMLYTRYLATHLTQEHPNILCNSVHPGIVDTKATSHDIHEAYPLGGYGMSVVLKPFQKSQFEGCVSAMYAATTTDRSGKYICPPARIEDGSELAQSNELMESLMKWTEQIVREKSDAVKEGCPLKFY